ncbi:hypothetical protein Tco_1061963 [Tanacetum coccineum]
MGTELDAPEFDMGPETQEVIATKTEPLDALPLNFVSPVNEMGGGMMRRGQRIITLTDRMKSPYYVRVVNVDTDENIEEMRLAPPSWSVTAKGGCFL